MTQAPNRRQRRLAMKYQGILKAKSKLPFQQWLEITRENFERGKELHAANIDAMEKRISENLESIEGIKIAAWKDEGYNDKEIEMLREANAILAVKDKNTWHSDKKVARKLMNDARESLNKRLND